MGNIVHTAQYLTDNFVYSANRQAEEHVVECNHNEDKTDKEEREMVRDIEELIKKTEQDMQIESPDMLSMWIETMCEWAYYNEYGHGMYVVVNDDGIPYCTEAPDDDDYCWELSLEANIDWNDVRDGYDDDPNSRWYVLDDNGVQTNIWSLVGYDRMCRALEAAIADRYNPEYLLTGDMLTSVERV